MTHNYWTAPAPINPVSIGPILIPTPAWMDQARCIGMFGDTFYPTAHKGSAANKPAALEEIETAKSFCRACPVVAECLDYGMNDTHGIWGNTTPEERQSIRRRADRARAREKRDSA